MQNKDFTVFILTHGRPDKIYTLKALADCGYTGKIYIVIDNEDKTADEYKQKFGDMVIQFDKALIAQTFDEGDNFNDRRAIIYARNATFQIAKDLGITYFMQLDDDYTTFDWRVDQNYRYKHRRLFQLDKILDTMLEYYKSIPNLLTLCMAQGGDFIGGAGSALLANGMKPRRKVMNTFICSTERPFQFFGRVNEDVNTYTNLGSRGGLMLTIPNVCVNQKETQSNSGGMTELYLDSGTYLKSFYTVMYQPSSVVVGMMGDTHMRMHHSIKWNNTVPVLLDEKYKKKSEEQLNQESYLTE